MEATQTATEQTNHEEAMVTKMSVKGIGCKPTGGLPSDDSKPNPLCIISGKAIGVKMGEGNDGKIWTAILGSFRGTNLATGVSVRSGKLFLPSGIQEVVEQQVRKLGDSGGFVKFILEIASVKATNPIGYSYQAKNLIPMQAEEDELADLIAIQAGREQKALPEAKPEVTKKK